jgi:hypothetical protein
MLGPTPKFRPQNNFSCFFTIANKLKNIKMELLGEKNLAQLIRTMKPVLNPGDYVFCTMPKGSAKLESIGRSETICEFKEKEGTTLVLERSIADNKGVAYEYVAAWITLDVHSSLEAVGLTAAFGKALTESNISANVIAGYYHDHIFVAKKDADKAISVLSEMSND